MLFISWSPFVPINLESLKQHFEYVSLFKRVREEFYDFNKLTINKGTSDVIAILLQDILVHIIEIALVAKIGKFAKLPVLIQEDSDFL